MQGVGEVLLLQQCFENLMPANLVNDRIAPFDKTSTSVETSASSDSACDEVAFMVLVLLPKAAKPV